MVSIYIPVCVCVYIERERHTHMYMASRIADFEAMAYFSVNRYQYRVKIFKNIKN